MTRIVVTPIDMSAPGSYLARKQAIKTYSQFQSAMAGTDVTAIEAAWDAIEALVVAHAKTEDGSPLMDALGIASAEEFDALIFAVIGKQETVPNPTASV
jgi:hypothetical protein